MSPFCIFGLRYFIRTIGYLNSLVKQKCIFANNSTVLRIVLLKIEEMLFAFSLWPRKPKLPVNSARLTSSGSSSVPCNSHCWYKRHEFKWFSDVMWHFMTTCISFLSSCTSVQTFCILLEAIFTKSQHNSTWACVAMEIRTVNYLLFQHYCHCL